MHRLYIALSLMVAMFLDAVIFARVNIAGITPDCVLVIIVSLGTLLGAVEAGAIGCVVGLIMDILFGRAVGINAVAYMIAGVAGGLFYKKYYADNNIIPMLTTAFCAFAKENTMALITKLIGGDFMYFEMLGTYILPSALLSAALCLPVHIYLKPRLMESNKKRYDRGVGGSR